MQRRILIRNVALTGAAMMILGLSSSSSLGSAASAADFVLRLNDQKESSAGSGRYERRTYDQSWSGSETAIIVCDAWDLHHCLNAVRRLEEFAPRLNDALVKARGLGMTVIHAPSDCMAAYEGHPARRRALETPKAARLPRDITSWKSRIASEEKATYPIDQSDGGEDDDPAEHAEWAAKLKGMGRNPGMPWKRQSDLIKIDGERDFISDRGDEVWSILEQRGIKNVILTGVHVNMCVLGRPFGLRQLASNGKRVVLMRDLTDSMYNPKRWPFVDHYTGTDLIISHIERFVCPTITSDQLLGGKPFRFKADPRPAVSAETSALIGPGQIVVDRSTFANQWSPIALPSSSWEAATFGAVKRYDGAAWYRCAVRLPSAAIEPGQGPLRLAFAARPDEGRVQAWLNGRALEAEADSAGPLAFRIAKESVLPDEANLLTLRAEHRGSAAGLGEAPILASASKPIHLRGRWQFRLGDDPSWSNMPLPARFGASTDIYYEVEP